MSSNPDRPRSDLDDTSANAGPPVPENPDWRDERTLDDDVSRELFSTIAEGESTTEDSGVDVSVAGTSGTSLEHQHEDGYRAKIMEEMMGIRRYLFEKLHLTNFGADLQDGRNLPKVLDTVDFAGVMNHWRENKFKKIITMVGAGISTSAGIPDFRSPETGLYSNLQKYNLPHPTAIFELDYFIKNPQPFFTLAKELYPGVFKPTPCHYFIKLLENHGLLHRHYTQNIDTLEHIAKISPELIVEAHGSFYTNHCLNCHKEYTKEWMKAEIFADRLPTCIEPGCGGIVKPDIVFFGESLPAKFHDAIDTDFDDCDLLIIMGTSLEVQPFASLPERVNDSCVRLLINRELVGNKPSVLSMLTGLNLGSSMEFGQPSSRRDVAWLGDCDDGAFEMARQLGFEEELKQLIAEGHAEIDAVLAEQARLAEQQQSQPAPEQAPEQQPQAEPQPTSSPPPPQSQTPPQPQSPDNPAT